MIPIEIPAPSTPVKDAVPPAGVTACSSAGKQQGAFLTVVLEKTLINAPPHSAAYP